MAIKNKKSDVKAKQAYKIHLEQNDYENVEIISSPTDIKAQKNGETFYFEIKMTKQTETYFGAATLTEWAQALKTPDNFKFVIAKTNEAEEKFSFEEYILQWSLWSIQQFRHLKYILALILMEKQKKGKGALLFS